MRKKRGHRNSREHFSLDSEYRKSFDFLKSSKLFIYISILIFFIFVALGFFFEDLINTIFKNFFNIDLNAQIFGRIEQLLLRTEGMSQTQLTGFIFVNNLQSSLFSIIFGIFFGAFPVFSAIINGYLLGFVGALSAKTGGIWILWRVLPHGIFELPAIFISLGLGLKFGTLFFTKQKKGFFLDFLANSFRVFLLIIVPLLIVAALIEGALIFLT
jgi:stage II sporulation protein M